VIRKNDEICQSDVRGGESATGSHNEWISVNNWGAGFIRPY